VIFLLDEVALGQVAHRVLWFYPIGIIPPVLRIAYTDDGV
jgi:hypothetical protein